MVHKPEPEMIQTPEVLVIDLRYRPVADPTVWVRTLDDLLTWEPRSRPNELYRLTGRAEVRQQPWSDELAGDLACRCAGTDPFAWMLSYITEAEAGIGNYLIVDRTRTEVWIKMSIPDPRSSGSDCLLELLGSAQRGARPALAMMSDAEAEDGDYGRSGLAGLADLPPILYLDAEAAEHAGGLEHLLASPCETIRTPDGGVILVIRPSLWNMPTSEERQVTAAVKEHLGISEDHPLVLMDVSPSEQQEPTPMATTEDANQPGAITSPYKGSTALDWPIKHDDFTEWVNQRSESIHRRGSGKSPSGYAVKVALRCRARAEKEAVNLPSSDRYSLVFVSNPGKATRDAMLDVLFRGDSPIFQVGFGESRFDRNGRVPSE